jgi:hypothetical protein
MQLESFAINLTSTQPETLFPFYRDVVALPLRPEMGDHALALGDATLFVDGHSEIDGPAKEPARCCSTSSCGTGRRAGAAGRAGVKFVRREGKEYWGGVISTFLDPDGNYCQLIEFKP